MKWVRRWQGASTRDVILWRNIRTLYEELLSQPDLLLGSKHNVTARDTSRFIRIFQHALHMYMCTCRAVNTPGIISYCLIL